MPVYEKRAQPGHWRVVVWVQNTRRETSCKGTREDAERVEAKLRKTAAPKPKMTKRDDPRAVAFWERVDRRGGPWLCWPWTGSATPDGYGSVAFKTDEGQRRTISAHRYAYELAKGPIPKDGPGRHGWCVCHRCDNRLCCNPAHLFLGSHEDNMGDASLKGRLYKRGAHIMSTTPTSDVSSDGGRSCC